MLATIRATDTSLFRACPVLSRVGINTLVGSAFGAACGSRSCPPRAGHRRVCRDGASRGEARWIAIGLKKLLNAVRTKKIDVSPRLMDQLRGMPLDDLGFAKVDLHRAIRRGFPEVVYGEGKTLEQIVAIVSRIDAGQADRSGDPGRLRMCMPRPSPRSRRRLNFNDAPRGLVVRCGPGGESRGVWASS